jgi:hypothetical protein
MPAYVAYKKSLKGTSQFWRLSTAWSVKKWREHIKIISNNLRT